MPQPSFQYVYPQVELTIPNGQTVSQWVEINPPDDSRDTWAFCELVTPATIDASRTLTLEYSDSDAGSHADAMVTQNTSGDLDPITQTASASIALHPVQYSVLHKYVRLKASGAVAGNRTYKLTYRRV